MVQSWFINFQNSFRAASKRCQKIHQQVSKQTADTARAVSRSFRAGSWESLRNLKGATSGSTRYINSPHRTALATILSKQIQNLHNTVSNYANAKLPKTSATCRKLHCHLRAINQVLVSAWIGLGYPRNGYLSTALKAQCTCTAWLHKPLMLAALSWRLPPRQILHSRNSGTK